MIIGIDGNEANVEKRVGVSEFAFELLLEFQKYQSDEVQFEIYLKDQPSSDFPQATEFWHYKVFGPKKLWTQIALPGRLLLERRKPDVFFTPSHYSPRFSSCPTVISIMDVAYQHFPHLFAKKDLYQLQKWTKYSVEKAQAIITISQGSKHDILKSYSLPDSRVHVIYPGIKKELKVVMEDVKPHIYPFKELQTKFGVQDNYLLFVGTLQPRKNITRIIEAFSKVHEVKDHALQLVIVGKKGWLYEEILAAPEKFGVSEDVVFLDFVNDEELAILYKHAQIFVWPSLYEGFGLPVLEAMGYGCPVITSNVSSLPEAGGNAAMYVNPNSTEDITKTIEKVLGDKNLRSDMIAKGKKQVSKFSWEKAAKETLDVLRKVGGTNER